MKKIPFTILICTIIILIVLVAGGVFLKSYCQAPDILYCRNLIAIEFVVNRYQTLLSAIIALASAIIGIRAIHDQIKSSERLASKAKREKGVAYYMAFRIACEQYITDIEKIFDESMHYPKDDNVHVEISMWNYITRRPNVLVFDWHLAEIDNEILIVSMASASSLIEKLHFAVIGAPVTKTDNSAIFNKNFWPLFESLIRDFRIEYERCNDPLKS